MIYHIPSDPSAPAQPILLYPSFSHLLMNISTWVDTPNTIYCFSCMLQEEAIDNTFKNYAPSLSPEKRASILAVLDEAVQQGRCRWKQAPGEKIAVAWILEALRGFGVEGLPSNEELESVADWQVFYNYPSLRSFLEKYAGNEQVKFMWMI